MSFNATTARQQAGRAGRGDHRAAAQLFNAIIDAIGNLSDTELGFIDGVTAGAVTASKALVVDSNKDLASLRHLTLTGNIRHSVASVAAAGSAKTDAAALTADLNIVTGADNAKGVALPAAVAGDEIVVVNTSTTASLKVYPKDSDDATINALATDAAFTMEPGAEMRFKCLDATHWYCKQEAPTGTVTASGTGGTSTATLQKMAGVVTTDAITTASGASHVMTITNALVASGDLVVVWLIGGSNTRLNTQIQAVAGSSSITVTLQNNHASAINGTVIFGFRVIKQ